MCEENIRKRANHIICWADSILLKYVKLIIDQVKFIIIT